MNSVKINYQKAAQMMFKISHYHKKKKLKSLKNAHDVCAEWDKKISGHG